MPKGIGYFGKAAGKVLGKYGAMGAVKAAHKKKKKHKESFAKWLRKQRKGSSDKGVMTEADLKRYKTMWGKKRTSRPRKRKTKVTRRTLEKRM